MESRARRAHAGAQSSARMCSEVRRRCAALPGMRVHPRRKREREDRCFASASLEMSDVGARQRRRAAPPPVLGRARRNAGDRRCAETCCVAAQCSTVSARSSDHGADRRGVDVGLDDECLKEDREQSGEQRRGARPFAPARSLVASARPVIMPTLQCNRAARPTRHASDFDQKRRISAERRGARSEAPPRRWPVAGVPPASGRFTGSVPRLNRQSMRSPPARRSNASTGSGASSAMNSPSRRAGLARRSAIISRVNASIEPRPVHRPRARDGADRAAAMRRGASVKPAMFASRAHGIGVRAPSRPMPEGQNAIASGSRSRSNGTSACGKPKLIALIDERRAA